MNALVEKTARALLEAAASPVERALREIFEEVKITHDSKRRRLVLTFEVVPTRDALGISMFCQAEFADKKVLYLYELRIEST